jgi:hypothetical protein
VSLFRTAALINRTRRGLATMTSCPAAAARRLTHGEWVPTSRMTRAGGSVATKDCSAAGIVATLPRAVTVPATSS